MDEPLTKSLERYDVLDRIAVGGMAEVFIAKAYGAHGFEKTLAIKRILPELARDPEFEARFIAEAKVAVRLSHANVVQVFDFGRIGESLFIAMEYVDGLDLAAMLRKFKDQKRQVPLPAAFHIAIEIVRALDFAHGHNVVHRDVSPSNILISRAGEVKIADFGIAVAAQPHAKSSAGPRRVMGKWRYMSPEQTRGDVLDTRSDMFSAASVIYELFTNEKLFPGDEAEDIIKNIADMAIPKMTAIRTNLPSRLDDVIAGPLARKPIDRPNRPATVLRSLIELSYESSIMATALDVAEALASVIPPKKEDGRGALDDVIRKQLADQSIARQTAVTSNPPEVEAETETKPLGSTTGLFRKIDIDGLSRLEEVDFNTRVAPPRERPASESNPVLPGDSGIGALYDNYDRDRHTEVGGPPTGQVPKDSGSWQKKPMKRAGRGPIRALWAAFLVLLVAGAGVVVWAMQRDTGQTEILPPPVKDATIDTQGTLAIDPQVEGATGFIEVLGDEGSRVPIPPSRHDRVFGVRVTANKKLHLHLEATGYLPYDDENVSVAAGETLRIAPPLLGAPAKLHVITEPPGAQITLSGRLLGDSPTTFDGLTPGKMLTVGISKVGYVSVSRKVDLLPGQTAEITEALKPGERTASVKIDVQGGWGNVYLKGKLLGEAPGKNGPLTVTLPIGKHALQLKNPKSKPPRTWSLTCEVKETGDNVCRTKFPD